MNTEQKPASPFEHETCGRCGGSGHYSYNTMHGTLCYGCSGSGLRFTKRGDLARRMFVDSLKVPIEDVQVGQSVHVEGSMSATFWMKVETISEPRKSGASWRPDPVGTDELQGVAGTWVPNFHIDVTGTRRGAPTSASFQAGQMVRVGHTADEKAPKLAAALTYQASLTKSGKARRGEVVPA